MRENHVVPHPFNDSVEAKADVRDIGRAVAEDRAKFPARYRKLKEEVKALGIDEVAPVEARARASREIVAPDGRKIPSLQQRMAG